MEISRFWRFQEQRYTLTGEQCSYCGRILFPPRDICPECHNPADIKYRLSGMGEVYSYTTLYDPPAGYEAQAPYTVAIIKLVEGPMITAQLTDLGDKPVTIGMPVEMVTRKIREYGDKGPIVYGYKFRPVFRAGANEQNHRDIQPVDNSGVIFAAKG